VNEFYYRFGRWWPLISPVEDYAEEAAFAAELLRTADREVRSVLELGSGGGHNAWYLKAHFEMTLVDLSEQMLAVSQTLNPECRHLQGDMRSTQLNSRFDAIFVHDAVEYMASERDLAAAMETAFVHCQPGGIAVFLPDHTRETFAPSTGHGGADGPDGRSCRYLEWSHDSDPNESWIQTEYAFIFRDPDGGIEVAHETHKTGLFSEMTWLRLLREQGFTAESLHEETDEDRPPRTLFIGRVPRD